MDIVLPENRVLELAMMRRELRLFRVDVGGGIDDKWGA